MASKSLIGLVPDEWEQTTLGEICRRGGGDIQTGPFGSQLHASDYVPAGIPSIMPQNIGDNRIVTDGIARITIDDAKRLSRYRVRTGDIVYSRRGDVERRALIRNEEDGWLCGTGCLRVRFGNDVVDPLFASYYLGHPIVREWIVRHAVGATMLNLNTSILSDLPFIAPPLLEQKEIAQFISALDDKIEINRRMSATLEAMAQALFKSWFVDLDPIKVKAKELVSAGILEIGDGYRAKNDELGEPGLPFIRVANLNNRIDTENAERLREESVAKAGNKISRIGDVAFTSKGTIGRFARVGETTERFVYSPQVCFWRSLDNKRLHPAILYCWMQTDDFKAQILAVAGQTDMAPYVSLRDQREMLVPQYPTTQAELGAKIEPLLARKSLNDAESSTLVALRDALLPKLISGQLRIPDIEKTKIAV